MTDRELMQMALDALDEVNKLSVGERAVCLAGEIDTAMDALRERLAQPEQEPVAYGVLDADGQIDWTVEYPFSNEPGWPDSVPLYTAPPKREWSGLSVSKAEDLLGEFENDPYEMLFALDKYLREKNT